MPIIEDILTRQAMPHSIDAEKDKKQPKVKAA